MGPFYSGAMRVALATARIEKNRGRILQWGFEIVGPFYSGAMPPALAPEGIDIAGAC